MIDNLYELIGKRIYAYPPELCDDSVDVLDIGDIEFTNNGIIIYGDIGTICCRQNCKCIGSWGWHNVKLQFNNKELKNKTIDEFIEYLKQFIC